MNALVGRRLLLLFQALSRKSSSDPVRPFVRVCIYKETSSSFASTMPPTRTHKRNKIRSFFSHRIYFTLCVCVYLLHGRDSRVKTLCFIFGFFFFWLCGCTWRVGSAFARWQQATNCLFTFLRTRNIFRIIIFDRKKNPFTDGTNCREKQEDIQLMRFVIPLQD